MSTYRFVKAETLQTGDRLMVENNEMRITGISIDHGYIKLVLCSTKRGISYLATTRDNLVRKIND